MSRRLAAWAGPGRPPTGGVREAVGDLRTLAVGWRWDLTLQIAKAAASTAIGTLKGAVDAPAVPTGWSRSPFATAVRGLAQDAVLGPVLHAEVGLEAYGTDQLGINSGPVLLVANHASHLDSAAVLATLPAQWRERTAVGVTSDQFFQIWWKAGAAALAYNTFQLPAEPENPAEPDTGGALSTADSAQFDVQPLAEVLQSGWNVLVFPEGGRTRDGVVQPFHDAVAAVAAQLSVPVIPVGIRGTFTALPAGNRWPRRGRPRVAVRYGAQLAAARAESAEVFTARIHKAVADLVDEDETTWWTVQRAAASGGDGQLEAATPSARWRRIWQQSQAPVPGGRVQGHRIWRDATG